MYLHLRFFAAEYGGTCLRFSYRCPLVHPSRLLRLLSRMFRSQRYALPLLLLVLPVAGCVYTSVTRVGAPVSRPVVALDSVVVYRTADRVPGKYEEVALLNSSGSTGWTSEETMYRDMRKRAGLLGANGIILDGISEPSAGAKVAGAFLGVPAERKGKAIAIFVLDTTAPKP